MITKLKLWEPVSTGLKVFNNLKTKEVVGNLILKQATSGSHAQTS